MISMRSAAATRERLFTHNFIEYQRDLVVQASRTVTSDGIIEKNKMNHIFQLMDSLYIGTVNFKVMDSQGNYSVSEQSLMNLINQTMTQLKKSYQGKGIHPLIPALEEMTNNIQRYLTITQPQLKMVTDNENTEPGQEGSTYPSIFLKDEFEPVFSENFIRSQFDIYEQASRTIDSERLLEQETINSIIFYMRDLRASTQYFTIAGQKDESADVNGLLLLLDQSSTGLAGSFHLSGESPFVSAVKRIKENILQYIIEVQPQFSKTLELNQRENISNCVSAHTKIAMDTCGILSCLLWSTIQKPLTLDNGCETICGPKDAICPEVKLPRTVGQQKITWDICAPWNSIKALRADITTQSEEISALKKAPIRSSMF